ncbi:hypothetical protein AB0H42_30135 [Nocardia sp. NPDC050799]|uniref:hypothetical protein n=1 Tax=Nocardia sp. NPDC050799 TaxID=3154842 RepID=UPI00340FBE7D
MKAFIVSLIFGAGALFCTYLASLGFRGLATSTTKGYGEDIPDHIRTDPVRRRKANQLVAWYETTAAILYMPPSAYALWVAFDPEGQIPLPVLIGLAVYGLAVSMLAGYPVEKIKQRRSGSITRSSG